MDVVFLVGRILFALIFIFSGSTIHLSRQGVEYARAYGAPAPETLVPLSGVVAVVGGAMVVLGIWGDVGALLLAGFLIGITPFMHAFWREEEEQAQQMQMFNFLKNLALLGGALVTFYLFNQLQGEAGLSITDPLFERAD
jgi:putative oxidoreductase